jgi:hypothetical protein
MGRRNASAALPRGMELTTLHEILFIISSHPTENYFSRTKQLNQGKTQWLAV